MQTNKQTKITMSQNYVQMKIKWLHGNECSNNQFVRFIFHPFSFDSIGLQLNEIIWQSNDKFKQTNAIHFIFNPYERFYSE